MHQKNKDIQKKRYEGFLQTKSLWNDNTVHDLKQIKIQQKSSQINIYIDEKLRLGKYVERFVSFQLSQENDISILCENIQIQKEKRTLGELDCILQKENKTIHLEVIYKFYLIDENVGHTEIEHCIGPNRKDALIEKLTKLKEKQLPLLYSKECETYLKSINVKAEEISQQVYFKAQLFAPFSNKNIKLKTLNTNCISGFYMNQKQLSLFLDAKFYIPNKKDWLVEPHPQVNWLNYTQFHEVSHTYLARKYAPLCWLKLPNGKIEKIFLVWWKKKGIH